MERLHIPCAANLLAECKDPREDEHHIYAQRTAETRLQRCFGNLAINKIVGCRCIHERVLDKLPPPDYPPRDIMKEVVERERGKRWKD